MKNYKLKTSHVVVGIILLSAFIGASGSSSSTNTEPNPPSNTPTNSISKEDAQKELDEVISLAKDAGLVTSYEFSDKASVVYVSSLWYTQTVQFKKDFMAKVSTLKHAVTGYTRFEVRDYKSNEVVGEVKYNSLEVYK